MQDFKGLIRKIGKAAVFLLILVVILEGLSQLMERLAIKNDELIPPRNKSMVKIRQEEDHTIDVLILGDSLSYSSFSPMQLWNSHGITAFVGGQSGQTIQEAYYMLKNAWKNQAPRVVVLETNEIIQSGGGIKGIGESIRTTAGYYFPVFAYHDIWKSIVLGDRYPEENYKGFQFRVNQKPYKGGDYLEPTSEEQKITAVTKFYLKKIRSFCQEHGAKLIFISTPSPANCSVKTHNALQSYVKGTEIAYTDLNFSLGELGIDWTQDSLDGGDHLNLSGARKVTEWLGNYLKETCPLPDHRGEKRYSDWESLAREYKEKAEQKLNDMKKNVS